MGDQCTVYVERTVLMNEDLISKMVPDIKKNRWHQRRVTVREMMGGGGILKRNLGDGPSCA